MRSNLTPEEVNTLTHLNQFQWEVVEDNKLSIDDPRPTFHVYLIECKDYFDLGIKGDLRLKFYNNQLMSTVFYPSDLSTYLKRLEYVRAININENKKIIRNGCETYYGKDYKGKHYISWHDIRILKQLNAWIERHS
jgi:hypothetical protein